MINKRFFAFGTICMFLFSFSVLAKPVDNPFKKSLDTTNKYMAKGFIALWQSEHLVWRAQLFNQACSENSEPIIHAVNAGFRIVNRFIIDQAIINNELADEHARMVLQDSNKVYYQIFSKIYRLAYTRRLRLIQHYYPEIRHDLCAHAEKISHQYPVDVLPIMPWQITNQTEFKAWQADLFSLRVINKHFIEAFSVRQKSFSHVIDAEIYAMMRQEEKAIIDFASFSDSYQYRRLIDHEIAKLYQQEKGKILPPRLWLENYAHEATRWANQAYKLATVSALMQIKELYPELYQRIENHMHSYINLQLSTLEVDKKRLTKLFNRDG